MKWTKGNVISAGVGVIATATAFITNDIFINPQPQSVSSFIIDDRTYELDTILTSPGEFNPPVKMSEIKLDQNLGALAAHYSTALIAAAENLAPDFSNYLKNNPDIDDIPQEYLLCVETAPKTIRDLRDGVLTHAYECEESDEKNLSAMGFFNVNTKDYTKVVLVEYSQFGSQFCEGKLLRYGIGARLLMKVTESHRKALLSTPQQITASVIYGKARVAYSMKTFGITGPGVSRLVKTGTLTEDTYQGFISEIANLIVGVYKDTSDYIIYPQPLFFHQDIDIN